MKLQVTIKPKSFVHTYASAFQNVSIPTTIFSCLEIDRIVLINRYVILAEFYPYMQQNFVE